MQVQREAAKVNKRHGWMKPGEAWGYRRQAYRWVTELCQKTPEWNCIALQEHQLLKFIYRVTDTGMRVS